MRWISRRIDREASCFFLGELGNDKITRSEGTRPEPCKDILQASSGPLAVSLGLVPVDVDDGLVGRQGFDQVEPAMIPAFGLF